MTPQYLAALGGCPSENASFRPHHFNDGGYDYIFTSESSMLCRGYTQVTSYNTLRQTGSEDLAHIEKRYWSKTCKIASKHSLRLALWPLSRPAPTARRSKNMSWSIPSRFRKSRSIPASGSNPTLIFRRAVRPVDCRALPARGGVTC